MASFKSMIVTRSEMGMTTSSSGAGVGAAMGSGSNASAVLPRTAGALERGAAGRKGFVIILIAWAISALIVWAALHVGKD